jgi:hypothetical protein
MNDRFEKMQDEVLREEQVARDEEHTGAVEDDWDEFFEGEASEELL